MLIDQRSEDEINNLENILEENPKPSQDIEGSSGSYPLDVNYQIKTNGMEYYMQKGSDLREGDYVILSEENANPTNIYNLINKDYDKYHTFSAVPTSATGGSFTVPMTDETIKINEIKGNDKAINIEVSATETKTVNAIGNCRSFFNNRFDSSALDQGIDPLITGITDDFKGMYFSENDVPQSEKDTNWQIVNVYNSESAKQAIIKALSFDSFENPNNIYNPSLASFVPPGGGGFPSDRDGAYLYSINSKAIEYDLSFDFKNPAESTQITIKTIKAQRNIFGVEIGEKTGCWIKLIYDGLPAEYQFKDSLSKFNSFDFFIDAEKSDKIIGMKLWVGSYEENFFVFGDRDIAVDYITVIRKTQSEFRQEARYGFKLDVPYSRSTFYGLRANQHIKITDFFYKYSWGTDRLGTNIGSWNKFLERVESIELSYDGIFPETTAEGDRLMLYFYQPSQATRFYINHPCFIGDDESAQCFRAFPNSIQDPFVIDQNSKDIIIDDPTTIRQILSYAINWEYWIEDVIVIFIGISFAKAIGTTEELEVKLDYLDFKINLKNTEEQPRNARYSFNFNNLNDVNWIIPYDKPERFYGLDPTTVTIRNVPKDWQYTGSSQTVTSTTRFSFGNDKTIYHTGGKTTYPERVPLNIDANFQVEVSTSSDIESYEIFEDSASIGTFDPLKEPIRLIPIKKSSTNLIRSYKIIFTKDSQDTFEKNFEIKINNGNYRDIILDSISTYSSIDNYFTSPNYLKNVSLYWEEEVFHSSSEKKAIRNDSNQFATNQIMHIEASLDHTKNSAFFGSNGILEYNIKNSSGSLGTKSFSPNDDGIYKIFENTFDLKTIEDLESGFYDQELLYFNKINPNQIGFLRSLNSIEIFENKIFDPKFSFDATNYSYEFNVDVGNRNFSAYVLATNPKPEYYREYQNWTTELYSNNVMLNQTFIDNNYIKGIQTSQPNPKISFSFVNLDTNPTDVVLDEVSIVPYFHRETSGGRVLYNVTEFIGDTKIIDTINYTIEYIERVSPNKEHYIDVDIRLLSPIVSYEVYENRTLIFTSDSDSLVPIQNGTDNYNNYTIIFKDSLDIETNTSFLVYFNNTIMTLNPSEEKTYTLNMDFSGFENTTFHRGIYTTFIKFHEVGQVSNSTYVNNSIFSEPNFQVIGEIINSTKFENIDSTIKIEGNFTKDEDIGAIICYIIDERGLGDYADSSELRNIALMFGNQNSPKISFISPAVENQLFKTNFISVTTAITDAQDDVNGTLIRLSGKGYDSGFINYSKTQGNQYQEIFNPFELTTGILTITVIAWDDFLNYVYTYRDIQVVSFKEVIVDNITFGKVNSRPIFQKISCRADIEYTNESESAYFIDLGSGFEDADDYFIRRSPINVYYALDEQFSGISDSGSLTFWQFREFKRYDQLRFTVTSPLSSWEKDNFKSNSTHIEYFVRLRRQTNIRTYENVSIVNTIPIKFDNTEVKIIEITGGLNNDITNDSNVLIDFEGSTFSSLSINFTVPFILKSVDFAYKIIINRIGITGDQKSPLWSRLVIGIVVGAVIGGGARYLIGEIREDWKIVGNRRLLINLGIPMGIGAGIGILIGIFLLT
jgi:hypothetical protein